MKILLAGPRGFCAGVNMAIETLETAIRLYGTPIYVFHEIVHNKHVVDRFVKEGAVFIDSVEEVPEEEQTKLDDDAEDLDIPAPVVEEDNLDDDLELLD